MVLDMKRLRLKCITLLALGFMLRPSDIAPKSIYFNSSDDTVLPILFTEEQLEFVEGGLRCRFLGIKNDTSRSGFDVILPSVEDSKCDPVRALRCYMDRTREERLSAGGSVFVTLTRPFKPLGSSGVSKVLSEAIVLAGLGGLGFGPKSFRPTGATAAVSCGHEPEKVRKLGRWKTEAVFMEHYVHTRPKQSFTRDVLQFMG